MENKIYTALGNIMETVGAIEKGQKNTQQNFMFRGIDDFMNTLHGLFAKNRVIILPHEEEAIQETVSYTNSSGKPATQFRSKIHFRFHFVSTEDGSEVVTDGWGEAADNGDKGYNKCKSIALKYVLMQMFLVPTADIADPDKETPEEITQVTTTKRQTRSKPQPQSDLVPITRRPEDADWVNWLVKHAAQGDTREQCEAQVNTRKRTIPADLWDQIVTNL